MDPTNDRSEDGYGDRLALGADEASDENPAETGHDVGDEATNRRLGLRIGTASVAAAVVGLILFVGVFAVLTDDGGQVNGPKDTPAISASNNPDKDSVSTTTSTQQSPTADPIESQMVGDVFIDRTPSSAAELYENVDWWGISALEATAGMEHPFRSEAGDPVNAQELLDYMLFQFAVTTRSFSPQRQALFVHDYPGNNFDGRKRAQEEWAVSTNSSSLYQDDAYLLNEIWGVPLEIDLDSHIYTIKGQLVHRTNPTLFNMVRIFEYTLQVVPEEESNGDLVWKWVDFDVDNDKPLFVSDNNRDDTAFELYYSGPIDLPLPSE